MEKMLALVAALNEVDGNISLREDGVMYFEKNDKGEVTERYLIKPRPVANDEGVEEFVYVARKQK